MELTTIQDFLSHDYSTMFEAGSLFSYFSHPAIPIVSVVLYLLLSNVVFNFIRVTFKLEPKGPLIQTITVVHSALLAVYSGWTFINSWNIVMAYLLQNDYWTTFCDADNTLWTTHNLGFWVTHFYLSKYYEFIDTWIVLLKGKKPIFLQTYHHAGIVILMWMFVATGGALITLTFNSFIHTLMYTYYTLSALGYQSPLKNYLTQAQLLQFITGIAVTSPLLFASRSCINEAQWFAVVTIDLYAVVLIGLFYQFYVDSYIKKK
ncbi:sre1, partial [Symbiodinium microadriaticum]